MTGPPDTDLPDAVVDLPPTARFVAYVLLEDEWLDQPTIADRVGSPQRSVRHALGELDEADVLESRYAKGDARQREYRVSTD